MHESSAQSLPRGVLVLAWTGVVPFIAPLVWALIFPAEQWVAASAFIAYSALILSFLGGARWGRGLADQARVARFVEAVLPSLIGFVALLWVHDRVAAMMVLMVGHAIWMIVDLRDSGWTPAYRRMRGAISLLVIVLHGAWWLTL